MSGKENEEWIEKTVICPDCVRGRTVHWKENKSVNIPGDIIYLVRLAKVNMKL